MKPLVHAGLFAYSDDYLVALSLTETNVKPLVHAWLRPLLPLPSWHVFLVSLLAAIISSWFLAWLLLISLSMLAMLDSIANICFLWSTAHVQLY